jgi:hypothetical protein
MSDSFNKGPHVFVDNWYTSTLILKVLHERNTGCYGTVRLNRKGMPQALKKTETWRAYCCTYKVVAIKWHNP